MPTEADVTYGFNREQALELVNGLGQRDFEMKLYEPEPGAGGGVIHFMSPAGGIPARSTLTMGSASCDLYNSSSGGVLSDSGTNVTVYNMSDVAFGASRHGVAIKNAAGLYIAIVEACPA